MVTYDKIFAFKLMVSGQQYKQHADKRNVVGHVWVLSDDKENALEIVKRHVWKFSLYIVEQLNVYEFHTDQTLDLNVHELERVDRARKYGIASDIELWYVE